MTFHPKSPRDPKNTSQETNGKFKKGTPTLPAWRANFFKKAAIYTLGMLPSAWQRAISRVYTRIFEWPVSRIMIRPYCKYHYCDPNYLDQFKPPVGKNEYQSFQDFFIRRFKEVPPAKGKIVWACEGQLCHSGPVSEIPFSRVKGHIRKVHHIFGLEEDQLPQDYFFTNIFLHNKNYHRIHAPFAGLIKRIQHIKGDLIVLRPWIYHHNPSIPAFRNERINLDIEDQQGRTWYLSIVGGPAVGSIILPPEITVGARVNQLQELALFYLGSTCCMAGPDSISDAHHLGKWVEVGEEY
jgi:phosphatidylserine decarboxylase